MNPLFSASIFLCLCILLGCQQSNEQTVRAVDKTRTEYRGDTLAYSVLHRAPVNGNVLTGFAEIGGPKVGGRTKALVIDRTDSTHMLAAASDGGIWRSTDAGLSWQQVNDRLPSLVMNDIEQDPFDPQRFYAASYSVIREANGNYFSSIYVSNNGGIDFNVLATADSTNKITYPSVIKCSPTQPGVLYALSANNLPFEPLRLMRSTDSGVSFQRVFDTDEASEYFFDIHFDNTGKLYVMGNYSLFTSNSGNPGTFNAQGDSLPFTFFSGKVRTAPSNDSIIYVVGRSSAGTSNLVLVRSDQAGSNWNHLSAFSSGSFGTALGIHPTNPDIVFAGGVTLRASDDGGATFNFGTFNGIDNWDIIYDQNGDRVYQINDQGMGRLNITAPIFPIYGNSGENLDSNYRSQRLHHGDFHMSKSALLMGVQDDGSNWTASSSSRFKGLGGGDGGYCYFHQQDTAVVYTSTQNGGIRRINDIYGWPIGIGPQNFDNILNQLDQDGDNRPDEGGLFSTPFWVNYSDGDQLYYQTKKRIWRSNDRGDNWVPFTPSYDHIGNRSYMQIDGHSSTDPLLYYSVEDALFVIPNAATADSSDALQFNAPWDILDLKVSYLNDSTVYMAHTYNSGALLGKVTGMMGPSPQWTDISGNLPTGTFVRCIQPSAQNSDQIAVGTNDGLYVSDNGGLTWAKDSLFPNVQVRRMRVRPSDDRLFIFTYGRGPWSADFQSISTSVQAVEGSDIGISVFPNPVVDFLNVSVDPSVSISELRLYNTTGKIVQRVRSVNDQNRVDVSGLASGRYILSVLSADKRIRTVSIVVE